ncbi:hypothetical protein EUGRSUZ_H02973 [Eucalyptus grandis]|uniref:Uncharacterized protein n=2 Tax=Eucalyptus grandis TaxID=71139 RepID=A0ACC3JSL1_EUCGR|nr:hypothetical protein EUGRSUZ_H02973 [Eucalyptus grandis]
MNARRKRDPYLARNGVAAATCTSSKLKKRPAVLPSSGELSRLMVLVARLRTCAVTDGNQAGLEMNSGEPLPQLLRKLALSLHDSGFS